MNILEHREEFFGLIADAHGTPKKPLTEGTVLPQGARWVPHQPKAEIKPRKNGPASGFFQDLCLS